MYSTSQKLGHTNSFFICTIFLYFLLLSTIYNNSEDIKTMKENIYSSHVLTKTVLNKS